MSDETRFPFTLHRNGMTDRMKVVPTGYTLNRCTSEQLAEVTQFESSNAQKHNILNLIFRSKDMIQIPQQKKLRWERNSSE